MAERRMFAKSVICSDSFIDLPANAKLLYIQMNMMADDDGFLGNARGAMAFIDVPRDTLNILLESGYVLMPMPGIYVIRHWKVHNYIQKDRYKETVYHEAKEKLVVRDNVYYFAPVDNSVDNFY